MTTADRSVAPPADLGALGLTGPEDLTGVVAACLHRASSEVTVQEWALTEVPYDIDALTTLSRSRVRGSALTPDGERPFSIFVKVLRSWEHHPAFHFVPVEFRPFAITNLPWAVEPDVYRTGLRDALPAGLTMPATYAVRDLDATHAAVWMEDVTVVPQPWHAAEVAHAARLLGRFAGSPDVDAALAPLADTLRARTVRSYVDGRVSLQVLPLLRSPALWSHPSVARHFGPQRDRLLAAVERLPALVAELEQLPYGVAHGDASTRNLLARADDDAMVLIDFGFLSRAPLGFDLSQLVVGQVQLGERPAADVPGLLAAALPAYVDGLHDVGVPTDLATVARAQAIGGVIFSAISAVPFEQLDTSDPALDGLCRERAALQDVLLRRLEETEVRRPQPAPSGAAGAP